MLFDAGGVGMSKRSYSDRQKAEALAALDANGGIVNRTANQLGIPRKTLEQWAKDIGTGEDVAHIRQEKRIDLAQSLEDVAYKLVEAMPGKISEANLQQIATSAGIAIDKMRLLRGEATVITAEASRLREAADKLAEKYGKPVAEVLADMKAKKPELASVLIQ